MRSTTTAASTRSARCFGNSLPRLGSPTWWPARPMRWRPAATERGDSTCTTRSTAPMSMPSSRLDVPTSPLRRPDFSSSSIWSRRSRDSDPWWAFTSSTPGGGVPVCSPPTPSPPSVSPSAASSLRRVARRSARRRALTKIERRAVRLDRARAAGGASPARSSAAPDRPAAGPLTGSSTTLPSSPMSSIGHDDLDLERLAHAGVDDRDRPRARRPSKPPRKRAISSSGRWVADRPMRCGAGLPAPVTRCSSRSRVSDRWAPRLVAAMAWISSTITACTPRSVSRACEVSMR